LAGRATVLPISINLESLHACSRTKLIPIIQHPQKTLRPSDTDPHCYPLFPAMNTDQIALYDLAGELARRFHEARQRRLKEPGPDRPWFFHPIGYWIDLGYAGQLPEYDQPTSHLNIHTANFAQRMGTLSRVTMIWENKEAMVLSTIWLKVTLGTCSRIFTAARRIRISRISGAGYETRRNPH
jgi:hypothetical protein